MTRVTESVRREVVVDVPPQRAFDLFTADMTVWWPAAHHIGSAPIDQIVIEPRPGGRWYTKHQDGSETSTGYVVAWEPPSRFTVTWQIGADWQFHDDVVTTVDVGFTPVGEGRTRVTLEHRDLDGFGAEAAKMREIFEAPDAWTATIGAYAAAATA